MGPFRSYHQWCHMLPTRPVAQIKLLYFDSLPTDSAFFTVLKIQYKSMGNYNLFVDSEIQNCSEQKFNLSHSNQFSVFGNAINGKQSVESFVPDSLMRLLDSFLLTLTCRGQIVLVSPSVEQHLGHCQVIELLLGYDIYYHKFTANIQQITLPNRTIKTIHFWNMIDPKFIFLEES